MSTKSNGTDDIREVIEKYLSHWKWYLVSIVICIVLSLVKLRYSTNLYSIAASIKLDDKNADENVIEGYSKMYQFNSMSDASRQVKDEIEVLKSRSLIREVVEDLNLNIQIFGQGKFMATEIYTNPPITINFLSNDSIVNKINSTLNIHVESESKYLLEKEGEEKEGERYSFGDKVLTSFGNIVITPNVEDVNSLINKDFTIKITSIEKMSGYYSRAISINPNGNESSIINISLIDTKRKKGVAIINHLIKVYNDRIIENKNTIIEESSSFINKRLEVVSSELSQVDLSAEMVKKDNRLTDLGSQSSIYLQSERDIEKRQAETSTQLQLIEYMETYLTENNSNEDVVPANMSFEDNSINQISQRHNDLVLQRNRILKNSSEINPVVINLNEQINNLRRSLRSSLSNIKSSNLIKLDALNKEDSRISSRIYSAPKKERQFRDLNRQQDIKESLYLYLLQKREETAIANGIASPNAIVINDASASNSPVSPQRKMVYIAALIFGLLIPSAIIYLLDFMDNKVHSKNDIKNLTTIPFLGDIPKSNSKEKIVKKVDYSPLAEAYRLVRTNIDFMLSNIPREKGKVIFVTSTTSQEGKSHTSINLAKSISFSGKKVLIIETDIRVPKANKYLKIDNKVGLTEFLVNNKLTLSEVVNKIDDNLFMIPSGAIPPNPAELLMSNKMDSLFNSVRNDYDYVVVDTSAIGLVSDTLIIGKHADLFVYVVRANYIDKRQLNIAETAYLEKRLPNMTILLNGVTIKKGYGYGYGYGNYATERKSKWKLI